MAYAPSCAGWWAAPLVVPEFADVARVSAGGHAEFAGAFQRAKTKRLAPRQRAHPKALVPRLVSAPYAARHVPTPGNTPRSYLWAYAATPHGSPTAKNLRLALQRACAASHDCADGRRGDAARRQRNATFCVEPPGLTPGRASIVTALLAGCVPVLFAPEQTGSGPRTGAAGGTRPLAMLDTRCATGGAYVGARCGRFRERRRRHARDDS